MKALTWQGTEQVEVREVPDPRIEQPTDAIVRVTSTAICGSDLHLYSVLGPFLEAGDVLGHEFMGIVEEVGPEAHGSPVAEKVVAGVGKLPKPVARKLTETAGIDRLAALEASFDAVRRGGTVSVPGVYGGAANPMDLMTLFDKNLTIRMGQCNVRQWTDELLELVQRDGDVMGTETLATHRLGLSEAAEAYATFQKKQDGCIKVVLDPTR